LDVRREKSADDQRYISEVAIGLEAPAPIALLRALVEPHERWRSALVVSLARIQGLAPREVGAEVEQVREAGLVDRHALGLQRPFDEVVEEALERRVGLDLLLHVDHRNVGIGGGANLFTNNIRGLSMISQVSFERAHRR